MVLKLPGVKNIFKNSPEDGQVLKSRGQRNIPENDTDTNTQAFVWRGAWDAGTTYAIDDLVEHNGEAYVCTAASTNNEPPNASYWDLLSSDTDTTYTSSDFTHDDLTGFDVDKHKAWANSIAENIHGDNYTNSTYSSGDFTHDDLGGFDADKHRAWAASIAQNIHGDNYTDTQPTKEFWCEADGATAVIKGDFVVNATGDSVPMGIVFKCPHDFNSITSAEIILIPDGNDATADIDITSDYAADGEAYTTHSEADAASTYNLTANQIYSLDASGILSSLAANDYVGIKIVNNETNLANIIGFRMRYT